jgi:hypothetical protein
LRYTTFGSPVARIPNALFPAERAEQVETEGEGPLDVGDSQIDVVDSSRRHREPSLSALVVIHEKPTLHSTPGGVGVTQAMNSAALSGSVDASTATAYSMP